MPSPDTVPGYDELRAASRAERRRAQLTALGLWVFITVGYLSAVPFFSFHFYSVRGALNALLVVPILGWCVYRTYGYYRAVGRLSQAELVVTTLVPMLAIALLQLILRLM